LAGPVLALTAKACLGRVWVSVLSRWFGLACLMAMIVLIRLGETRWFVMVPLYVVRTTFMNATYPLDESVLMDSVPEDTRARWKSLASVTSVGWAGSAFFGGWLADHHGYEFTFFITFALQLSGTLVFLLIAPLVPPEKASAPSQASHTTRSSMSDHFEHNPRASVHSLSSRSADAEAENQRFRLLLFLHTL
jgi:MFS family permease